MLNPFQNPIPSKNRSLAAHGDPTTRHRNYSYASSRYGHPGPQSAIYSSKAGFEMGSLNIRHSQRGDTIVEVLIAITVISMVLVAAYVTTSHNVNSMTDTQEHSEALQLAQTQIEFLHNTTTPPTDGHCFDSNGNVQTAGGNPDPCKQDSSGNQTSSQPQFNVDITNDNPPTYKVTVTWTSLTHNTQDNVTLFYQP